MRTVITIGTATQDVFLESPRFAAFKDSHLNARSGFPEGAECLALGAKIEVTRLTLTTGGGATNAAVTFARQGIPTQCLMEVGNDTIGDGIVRELKREHVTPIAIRDKKNMTGYSTLLLTPTGERTVLVYRGASSDLHVSEGALKKLKADWVYIAPGNIPLRTIAGIVRHFKKSGAKIALNPSGSYLALGIEKLKPLLNSVSVFLVNREEAARLTRVPYENEARIFKTLDAYIDGVAVMTDGSRGVIVSDGKTMFHAKTFKERVIHNRTGAGDAFGSGFVATLVRANRIDRGSLQEAIRSGSANATSVVEHMGAKQGILTAREFRSARWKKLPIKMTAL
jgi:ribokinase